MRARACVCVCVRAYVVCVCLVRDNSKVDVNYGLYLTHIGVLTFNTDLKTTCW